MVTNYYHDNVITKLLIFLHSTEEKTGYEFPLKWSPELLLTLGNPFLLRPGPSNTFFVIGESPGVWKGKFKDESRSESGKTEFRFTTSFTRGKTGGERKGRKR